MSAPDGGNIERVEPLSYVVAAEEVRSNIRLRRIFSVVLLSIFGVSILLTYLLIFLWGYGTINLDKAFVHWLGGATIGQTVTLLVSIVGYLFPRHDRSRV
jgi:hypothetical protein